MTNTNTNTEPIFSRKAMRFIDDIFEGNYDNHLDVLSQAVFSRKKAVGEQKAAANLASLKPGDQVKIIGGIKPKYLRGYTGSVVAKNDSRVAPFNHTEGFLFIDLGFKIRRYGPIIGLPAQLIQKVGR